MTALVVSDMERQPWPDTRGPAPLVHGPCARCRAAVPPACSQHPRDCTGRRLDEDLERDLNTPFPADGSDIRVILNHFGERGIGYLLADAAETSR
jgi:hypothetical protein